MFSNKNNKLKTKGMSLSLKLIISFLILSLIPAIIIGYIGFYNANKGLENQAFSKLKAIEEIKSNQVKNFFDERLADVEVLSSTINVEDAIERLDHLFKGQGLNSEWYNMVADRVSPYFEKYIEEYGFNDLYLINLDGDIIYSVGQKDDLGVNLNSDGYSDSNLALAFNKAHEGAALVDYEYYEVSNAPAIFVAAPIENGKEEMQGVVALQIADRAINKIMNESTGLGDSGEAYLIGEDNIMRSNSRFSDQSTILETHIDSVAAEKALKGEEGHSIIENHKGKEVLSVYAPLNMSAFNWGIISEINKSEALKSSINLRNNTLWIIFFVTIIVIILAYLISRNLSNPIMMTVGLADKIANGELNSEKLNISSKDEIGVLANSLNIMENNLKNIVEKIIEIANNLSNSSEQLSSYSREISESAEQVGSDIQEVASGAEEQTAQIEETKNNIENLGNQIENTENISNNMNNQAENVMRIIESGNKEITNSINQVQEVKNQTIEVSEEINQLGDLSTKIGDIVEIINGISAQTNLLALNAAIEAARAGEAGQGFSVVADEIRQLAEESSKSTGKIEELINQIQKTVNKTVNKMDNAEKTVNKSVEAIHKTESSYKEIYNV